MTAEVTSARPSSSMNADDRIRAAVRGLAAIAGVPLPVVAAGIGIPRSTFLRKVHAKGPAQAFTAGEVAALAEYYDVPVGDLFDGLGYYKCPQQDSNLRRTVYSVGAFRSRGHLTLVSSGPGADDQDDTMTAPVRHLTAVSTAA